MSAGSRKKRTQQKVKKEPKERRERTPPFEEEEDEEFLPKERRDTWRDYEGRDQKLYPEEVQRRAKASRERSRAPPPHRDSRGRSPPRHSRPYNPYGGEEDMSPTEDPRTRSRGLGCHGVTALVLRASRGPRTPRDARKERCPPERGRARAAERRQSPGKVPRS